MSEKIMKQDENRTIQKMIKLFRQKNLMKIPTVCRRLKKCVHSHADSFGYYIALILILAILGSAAHIYRSERLQTAEISADAVEPEGMIETYSDLSAYEEDDASGLLLPPVSGTIITGFTDKEPIWSDVLDQWQTHTAIDFEAMAGEVVKAADDGFIVDCYRDPLYGNTIVMERSNGDMIRYSSLNTLQLVETGQQVSRGEIISAAGECIAEGNLGIHVHVEYIANGIYCDFSELYIDDKSSLQD